MSAEIHFGKTTTGPRCPKCGMTAHAADEFCNGQVVLTEEQMREAVERAADGIARDINGDFGDELDTSFEVYVVEVEGAHGKALAGFVYMGDLGEWVFMDDGHGGVTMESDSALLAAVKKQTPYAGW